MGVGAGGDQVLPGGEPAEQGRHPDTGTTGHLVQGRVQAVLGEHASGSIDDPPAIALRVRAQGRIASGVLLTRGPVWVAHRSQPTYQVE
jgi:hypothetical protein